MELEQQRASVERSPLLFIKVGLVGCTPIGFERQLATELGATYLNLDEIAGCIPEVTPQSDQSIEDAENERRKTAGIVMADLAVSRLVNGNNVMFDKFLNSPHNRARAKGIARRGGGRLIALNFKTPADVITERRLELQGLEQGSNGKIQSPTKEKQVVYSLLNRLHGVSSTEDIDRVITLTGRQDAERLSQNIRDSLVIGGLI